MNLCFQLIKIYSNIKCSKQNQNYFETIGWPAINGICGCYSRNDVFDNPWKKFKSHRDEVQRVNIEKQIIDICSLIIIITDHRRVPSNVTQSYCRSPVVIPSQTSFKLLYIFSPCHVPWDYEQIRWNMSYDQERILEYNILEIVGSGEPSVGWNNRGLNHY